MNINHQICAGNTDNEHKSTCQGDSGGPLACESRGKLLLVGILSYGYGNCSVTHKHNKPNVFTKVLKFIKWIQENKELNNNNPTKPPKECMWINCHPEWQFLNWILD